MANDVSLEKALIYRMAGLIDEETYNSYTKLYIENHKAEINEDLNTIRILLRSEQMRKEPLQDFGTPEDNKGLGSM